MTRRRVPYRANPRRGYEYVLRGDDRLDRSTRRTSDGVMCWSRRPGVREGHTNPDDSEDGDDRNDDRVEPDGRGSPRVERWLYLDLGLTKRRGSTNAITPSGEIAAVGALSCPGREDHVKLASLDDRAGEQPPAGARNDEVVGEPSHRPDRKVKLDHVGEDERRGDQSGAPEDLASRDGTPEAQVLTQRVERQVSGERPVVRPDLSILVDAYEISRRHLATRCR